ncbi:late competence development ComFB family protein [Nodosilinea sp. LEGE 07298]|uniref:late competence development ComFB family protein n=1 Tax=Nodosilinea sp. LEGE 07298 TaxID=2777970 RepID=UPI001880798D|nr:late competence development ComFB family protein [Nodosilinea sp. LEGE 07298]MBE9107816.1 late competence development ComFB family protein [Nodosilinea sp. LEGE 07298]
MELLVTEEVEKQLKTMHPRVLKYLKRVEVETYALNRLPSLYASSEKGWQHQYEKAGRELHNQIKSAVRQAFAAVQVDPIRSSEPLRGQDNEAANVALNALRDILRQPDLTWDGAITRLRTVLSRRGEQPSPTAANGTDTSHRTRYRGGPSETTNGEQADGNQGHYWRPGTYGSDVSWQKSHPSSSGNSSSEGGFDWNDARYSK